MLKLESKGWIIPVVALASLATFILDWLTPKGSAEFIFYFIPVALTILHHSPAFPIQVSLGITGLATLGYFASEDSDVDFQRAILNRVYAVIAMWVVGFLVRQIISGRNKVEENNWFKEKAAELAIHTRGELSMREVGDRIMNFLAETAGFKIGTLYISREEADDFQFLSGYACSPEDRKNSFLPGEGILGQAVLDQKTRVYSPLNNYSIRLNSSLGEGEIKNIVVIPLLKDEITIGVIEVGFLTNPEERMVEFLSDVSDQCASALRSADHKQKLAELLQQAQKHAEQLQAQQEELRVINEELEQQSRALKESHARLENQQAELEQSNQQLEEQTQELEHQKNLLDQQNQELEQKTDEIRKSSNYKSEFLANMSHELRTPLNSSLILAKLLMDNKPNTLNKEQVEYAEIIYKSGNDLLNLINDILDLSKVEAGKMTVTPEVIFVEQLTKSLEQVFKPMASQKGLEFKVHVDENVPHDLVNDRQRIEQILKNFLSNAFKFTHEGGVSIHVFMQDGQIAFAVADTGVGMSPDEQRIVFEAFRQADGTINRKYGGTGLGLSISRELAHLLGGEISVKSEKGHGSTFTLTLPIKLKETSPQERKLVAPMPAPAKQTSGNVEKAITFSFKDDRDKIQNFSRRMLIIEDDEDFAQILFGLAHEMNFGAIVSPTGEEGLELAKEFRPNAIVLDVRLPDHSGMIVLDQLKMNTVTRHIPVHIISSEDFSRSALEMGAVGYMLKPVKKEQLQVAFQNMSSMLEQGMKKVLVVEDDAVQRNHIKELIGDKEIEVMAVETSKEALELLSKHTYDCMIMDLSLPDMSGHELLAKLSNESSTYSFPPVIVYTARDLTPQEEEKLRLYSGSIIIKGAKSPERLLSEVTLFLHKVETELPPERQKMLRDLRSREKNLQDKTILVVDDDVRNIFALTASLETHGARIQTARNGKEALDKLGPEIDLILMDIMMPEMDGYEAMRRIRKDEKNKDVPIIALTAKAMKDDKQKCLEAGANDYLAKPIEIDKLLSLIRVWIPQKRRFS